MEKRKSTGLKLNLVVCIILTLALVFSNFIGLNLGVVEAHAELQQGDDGYYHISNYEELKAFATLVNSGTRDANAKLMNDIVCTDKEWIPIGYYNPATNFCRYEGHFDGQGHKIIGLSNADIDDIDNNDNQGLFGSVGIILESNQPGIVENIGIEGTDIHGHYIVGGVVGQNYGIVTNCYNTGVVSGVRAVGGVVGQNCGTITKSYNTGTIFSQEQLVGGVAGYSWLGSITNCYNMGAISGKSYGVGGLVGYNDRGGILTKSYNAGVVSGQGDNVGGVAGENSGGTITNCYYDASICVYYDDQSIHPLGAISKNDDLANNVKGLTTDQMTGGNLSTTFAGEDNPWLFKENDANNYFYPHLNGVNFEFEDGLNNSGATIEVKYWPARRLNGNGGSEDAPYEISDYNMLKQFSDIVNGTNGYTNKPGACAILTADIVCTDKLWKPIGYIYSNYSVYYTGHFNGQGYKIIGLSNADIPDIDAGIHESDYQGLFGLIYREYGCIGTVENVGVENSDIHGRYYVGGVVGANYIGTIKNSYNTGKVSGQKYVGGVVGYNNINTGTIKNSYNTGTVSGQDYVGGVVGYNDEGTIINCYNSGTVTVIADHTRIGGVVGGNVIGTIINCYNSGTVSGQDFYDGVIGGVIGSNYRGIIKNCYFDIENGNVANAIGESSGTNTVDHVSGLTTDQMTGTEALSSNNMSFSAPEGEDSYVNPWITKADYVDENHFVWYYPHLIGFERDEERSVITNSEQITNWPAYREGRIEYNEPASYEYNGMYPTAKIVLGDDTVPRGYTSEYYKFTGGSWSEDSTYLIPSDPGLYKILITDSDYNTIVKYFSILESSPTYSKYGENTWDVTQPENCKDVGTYRLVNEENSGRISFTKDFTITQKNLTVTANSAEKTYGDVNPALTYTISGLVNNDSESGSLTRAVGEDAGTYAINQGSVTAGNNYIIAYTGADFTIKPKALTVTANSAEKTYGDANPALTYTISGLINNDSESGSLTRTAGENVGTYAINQGSVTAGNNYTIAYTGADFTIKPKALTVTANTAEKTYGDADPTLTYTISGLVNNDSASGSLTRAAGENVGTYAISEGSLTAGINYTMNYTGAVFTINPKILNDESHNITIDLSYESTTYDGTEKKPSVTVRDGDKTVDADEYLVSYSGNVDAGTATVTVSDKDGGNYTVSGTKTFVIHKALAGVDTAPSVITGLTYNGKPQALVTAGTAKDNLKVVYALGSDSKNILAADAEGTPTAEKKWKETVPSATKAGTYYVWYKVAVDGNHSFGNDEAVCLPVTIARANVTVTADNKTKTYGTSDAQLTATVSGLAEGDSTDLIAFSLSREAGENAGTYKITVTGESVQQNYTVSFVPGTFTITKANPSYEVPTGLNGIEGDKLSSITLTDNWKWNDADITLEEAGTKSFKATYTPSDTLNYNVVTDIDVSVEVKEPEKKPDPQPEPQIVYNDEPEVPDTDKDTIPTGTVTKTVTNIDGSVTTITTIYNEDKTVTEKSVREYKNGNKITKITLTDEKGSKIISASETVNIAKNGTTTVTTNISNNSGCRYSSEVKTTASGKETITTETKNPDKSSTYVKMVTTPEGNITRNTLVTNSKGKTTITIGSYKVDPNAQNTTGAGTGTGSATGKTGTETTTGSSGAGTTTGSIGTGNASGSGNGGKGNTTGNTGKANTAVGIAVIANNLLSSLNNNNKNKVGESTLTSIADMLAGSLQICSDTLADGAETISEMKFKVTSDDKIKFTGCDTVLEEITVPSKVEINGKTYHVTSVAKGAFAGCESLNTIKMGKSIVSVGAGACAGLENLKEIVFLSKNKDGIKIGKGAFTGIADDAKFYGRASKAVRQKTLKRIKKSGYKAIEEIIKIK